MATMTFLAVTNFFYGAFSKIPNNITIVFLFFLKLNQSQNTNHKFFFGVFLQKPKTRFFGDENKIVLKLKYKICISAFVLYCKRKLCTNFQKILIFKPPGIFWKWKCWRACAGACRNFRFRLLKTCLTFGKLTCSVW